MNKIKLYRYQYRMFNGKEIYTNICSHQQWQDHYRSYCTIVKKEDDPIWDSKLKEYI